MVIIDFIFYTFYRIIYGMVAESRRSSARVTTIAFMSVLSGLYTLFFKNILKQHNFVGWIVVAPPVLVFIILLLLYGSEKELKALEERRKNDSIVWPFLLILLLIGTFFYALAGG